MKPLNIIPRFFGIQIFQIDLHIKILYFPQVIWGLATDESLDEDVKITILATGFGVSNIPGMNTTIEVNNASVSSGKSTEPLKIRGKMRGLLSVFSARKSATPFG